MNNVFFFLGGVLILNAFPPNKRYSILKTKATFSTFILAKGNICDVKKSKATDKESYLFWNVRNRLLWTALKENPAEKRLKTLRLHVCYSNYTARKCICFFPPKQIIKSETHQSYNKSHSEKVHLNRHKKEVLFSD